MRDRLAAPPTRRPPHDPSHTIAKVVQVRGPPVRYLRRGLPHGQARTTTRCPTVSKAVARDLVARDVGHRRGDRPTFKPTRPAPSGPLGIDRRSASRRGRSRGRDARTRPGPHRWLHRASRSDPRDPDPRPPTWVDAGREFIARSPRRSERNSADRRHGAGDRRLERTTAG